MVERGRMLGGVCVNTGTIPSKTLREAVLYLTGMNQRELYGASYRVKEKITPADLLARTQHVIGKEVEVVRSQLMRNRIDLRTGHGRFIDEHTVLIEDPNSAERVTIRRAIRHHRDGHQTRPTTRSGIRRGKGARFRRNLGSQDHSGVDGGRRSRGDRYRIRLHVRSAGHQGDRCREARLDAGLL